MNSLQGKPGPKYDGMDTVVLRLERDEACPLGRKERDVNKFWSQLLYL